MVDDDLQSTLALLSNRHPAAVKPGAAGGVSEPPTRKISIACIAKIP
jgi:hypothetical protein